VWNWQAGPDAVVRHPVDNLDGVRQLIVNEHAQIVITSQDKKVRTFSLVDGSMPVQPIQLPPQAGLVNNVAISTDGQWITTAGADGRVLVWSLAHGQPPTGPTYELFGQHGEVIQVRYLRAGTTTVVMSLGVDGTVRRWELPSAPRFERYHNRVLQMDLSHDGHWLATAGQDGRAFILDPHDLTKPPVATVSVKNPLRAVFFDPTEPHRILILGQSDRTPALWSWSSDGKTKRLQKYDLASVPRYGYLVSIAISPDGKTVAGGDTGGTIHLWDALTGKLQARELRSTTGHPAYSVAFDPTGQLLAVTDGSGVRLWRWHTIERPTSLKDAANVTSVTFDPSRKHLLAGTAGDGTVKIWTRDGKPDEPLLAHGYLSSSLSFSNDGGLLAVGTAEGLGEVWDVHSGSPVAVMLDRHHSASVNDVKFLPGDHSTLISASDDTTVAQFPCPACTDQDKVIRDAENWDRQVGQG
jgi:WD40 repeat protein